MTAEHAPPRQAVLLPPALLLWLAACVQMPVSTAPSPPPPPPPLASTVPNHLPPGVRPNLSARWLDPRGNLAWPPDDGFAAVPAGVVLPPGMLIDRFGATTGRFFSPKGASFDARALPYACETQVYTAYRVERPLYVWSGKAAEWFDEPGGATQFETDATVAQLLKDHTIAAVRRAGPGPCDEAPY
jgi:Tuberculosis necrotizing toxin